MKAKDITDIPAQVIKLGKLINYLPVTGLSGVMQFFDISGIKEVPFIDGLLYGEVPQKFSTLSMEIYHRRFVANFYNVPLQKQIEYYQREPIWEEIDSFLLDMKEMFHFLKDNEFTGLIKVRNIVDHTTSFIFMESGLIIAAERDGYKGRAVLIDILDDMINYHCKISVYRVNHEQLSLYFSLYKHIQTTTDFNKVKDIIKNLDISVIQIVKRDDIDLLFDIFIDSYQPDYNDITFYEVYNIYRLATTIPKSDYNDLKETTSSILNKIRKKEFARIRLSCPVCCSTVSMFETVCPVCGTVLINREGI